MNWITYLGIALALAMDAFAVSIAAGMKLASVTPRHVFRLSFHFGFFQFLMPVIGWYIGKQVATVISGFDHWIAFGLLSLVGGRMLWEAHSEVAPETKTDPTRGMLLVALSLATSIDALVAGVSLAFLGESIWIPSVIVGVVTAALVSIGIRFGNRLGSRWGHWAEVVGGCVVILIGLRIMMMDITS